MHASVRYRSVYDWRTREPGLLAVICFFFQAEDGIRDVAVTGVQRCALPICLLYGPRGVTTLTLSPGPADTPRLRRIVAAVAAERGAVEDDGWQEDVAQNSLGRLPTADELAWAAEMLLGPEAGKLHRSVLYLDRGRPRGIHRSPAAGPMAGPPAAGSARPAAARPAGSCPSWSSAPAAGARPGGRSAKGCGSPAVPRTPLRARRARPRAPSRRSRAAAWRSPGARPGAGPRARSRCSPARTGPGRGGTGPGCCPAPAAVRPSAWSPAGARCSC